MQSDIHASSLGNRWKSLRVLRPANLKQLLREAIRPITLPLLAQISSCPRTKRIQTAVKMGVGESLSAWTHLPPNHFYRNEAPTLSPSSTSTFFQNSEGLVVSGGQFNNALGHNFITIHLNRKFLKSISEFATMLR